MIINHPHLGPRDASEFTILGDASLINRPDWQAGDPEAALQSEVSQLRDKLQLVLNWCDSCFAWDMT